MDVIDGWHATLIMSSTFQDNSLAEPQSIHNTDLHLEARCRSGISSCPSSAEEKVVATTFTCVVSFVMCRRGIKATGAKCVSCEESRSLGKRKLGPSRGEFSPRRTYSSKIQFQRKLVIISQIVSLPFFSNSQAANVSDHSKSINLSEI